MRSDTERNRKRLIKSAGHLVARKGAAVKMTDVAERAEVSTATAYRHFSSVDEILAEFRYSVGLSLLQFSLKQETHGVELLATVSREWVRLVVKHGTAMVHTRSQEGYLARLRSGVRYLTVQAEALERPIAEAAAEMGLPDPGDEGLFLWNILFDPREIFDLLATLGLTEDDVARRLTAALCAAIGGWTNERID
ncbi:TetR/AcrR family transcriptional regulator [Tsukamurella soli]|uniref:TetR/AcrR family transcriptional regulator n=1 Tax=Tsukamurella soli TaxID=644556 RepID=UPI0031E688C7